MAARTYSDEEKRRALDLYEQEGPRAVETQLGIPKSTVGKWAVDAGIATRSTETRAANIQAAAQSIAQRKLALAEALLDEVEKLRLQLWEPCVERKVVTLAGGKDAPGSWEIVDVELEQPTFTDQRTIITSVAIAIDKVQILTGDVTSRVETRNQTDRPAAEERLAKLIELGTARRVS